MIATTHQVDKLLRENHVFTQFGFAMLIGRLKGIYAKDSSEAALCNATEEINRFLEKFQPIMQDDFEVIAGL